MSSEDTDYVCSLDQASIKKAKDELNENPQDRLAAVQALREWIQAQPHISCPKLDTIALLRFLRGAKFSQVRARELIENNFLLKSKAPDLFGDIDMFDEKLWTIMETGCVVPLPKRTPEGCQIFIQRIGKMDIKSFEIKPAIRSTAVLFEYIAKSEMSQVNGSVFLYDYTGVGAKFMTKMMGNDIKKFVSLWPKNTPGRFKQFQIYNPGVVFEIMYTFTKPFLPQKWHNRIKIHETLETLYKDIPMDCLPVEYLPDDYEGPHVGSIDDILKDFLSSIMEKKFRDELLYKTSMAFSVDESKRPAETVTEHFRKLNVD